MDLSRSRTLASSSFAGSQRTVMFRSLPLTPRMPSRFLRSASIGSRSSIVPSGVSNVNSFEVPATAAGVVVAPAASTTMGLARYVTFSPRISAAAWFTAVNIFWYSPQRQMFPARASVICGVVGLGTARSSATVDMMNPRVQMPHWNPPSSQNARCTGCSPATPGPFASEATVSIFWPRPSRALRTVQPFTALPSTSTPHAPHCARSQPRFEFVRPSWKFIVSQRLSRLSTMTSRFTPSMSSETRRIVAGSGPPIVADVVVVVVGASALVTTTAPPSTTPAVAAPAPMIPTNEVGVRALAMVLRCASSDPWSVFGDGALVQLARQSQRTGAAAISRGGDLRQDRERDLRGSASAEVEADRRVHLAQALFGDAFVAQHPLDEDRLASAAEQTDVARLGADGRAKRVRVELVAARRDDDERVPADLHRLERLDHVGVHHLDAVGEPLARRELAAVLDDGDLVVEQRGHARDRETDVAAADDDEARLREHRLDEQLVRIVERHRARGPLTERIRRGGRRALDGPPAGRRREDVAEQLAIADAQRTLARFDPDPHRPAADEPRVPRQLLGELVLAERRLARADDAARLVERVTLDAPAAERAREAAEVVDDHLRADDLGRGPDRAHDGADRVAAAFTLELRHALVDLPHSTIVDARVQPYAPAVALAIRLIGRPSVAASGAAREIPGHKPWGLLAYLLLAPAAPTRRGVSELLWSDAEDPLAALRWSLHQVRRGIGPDANVTERDGRLSLELGDVSIDAHLVLRGDLTPEQVEAIGQCELLEGLFFDDAPAFEQWLTLERQRVGSALRDALRWAATTLARSQPSRALRLIQRVIALDPTDDAVHELAVDIHVSRGDRAGAERYLDSIARTYRAELGIEPPTAIRDRKSTRLNSSHVA